LDAYIFSCKILDPWTEGIQKTIVPSAYTV
jgi:hypothetical protein